MNTKNEEPEVIHPHLENKSPEPMTTPTTIAEVVPNEPEPQLSDSQFFNSLTPAQEAFKRLQRNKRAMMSLALLIFFALLAFIGPPIYQHIGEPIHSDLGGIIGPDQYHSPDHSEASQQDQGPSAHHWLGVDDAGRDILARIMQGTFISIAVALLVEVVDIMLGLTIGVLAGFFGGWIDIFLARFTDLMFAFPSLLFAILIAGILGPNTDDFFNRIPFLNGGYARLALVSLALAFTTWPLMARYVRGQTMQLKEQQFIEAARTSGTTNVQIILRHIVPNLISLVFIASTLNIANTIIGEAGLSVLGLGVQLPGSSLGLMIANGLNSVDLFPWEIIVPTTVLALVVLAISFLGDGLRDAFDVSMSQTG
jgi:oligopeptide transport system permease protein